MENNYYSETHPAQTLAEAESTAARLAGVIGALNVRVLISGAAAFLLLSLSGLLFLGVLSGNSEFTLGLPIGLLPSLVLLSMYVTYKAFEIFLDVLSMRNSLARLLRVYERAILNASISMPTGGLV